MPRIPTRTTPYDTPGRQHRHYKNKRDQILRFLGKSAYINGSQFAILWISARGDAEMFASPGLQELLDPGQGSLFRPDIIDRAKSLAEKAGAESMASLLAGAIAEEPEQVDGRVGGKRKSMEADGMMDDGEEDAAADDNDEGEEENVAPHSFATFDEISSSNSLGLTMPPAKRARSSPSPIKPSSNTSCLSTPSGNPKAFINPDFSIDPIANPFAPPSAAGAEAPSTAGRVEARALRSIRVNSTHDSSHSISSKLASAAIPAKRSISGASTPSSASNVALHSHSATFTTAGALKSFLENKFSQLQQNSCKIVAKAWLKVIEPKKQTHYPYQKGEEGRPPWWPSAARHREPDHLMKPERIALLMTMLGSGRVPIQRLEIASAELAVHLKQEKMAIMRDIYKVAREEERLRLKGKSGGGFTSFTVELPPARSSYDATSLAEGDKSGLVSRDRRNVANVRASTLLHPSLSSHSLRPAVSNALGRGRHSDPLPRRTSPVLSPYPQQQLELPFLQVQSHGLDHGFHYQPLGVNAQPLIGMNGNECQWVGMGGISLAPMGDMDVFTCESGRFDLVAPPLSSGTTATGHGYYHSILPPQPGDEFLNGNIGVGSSLEGMSWTSTPADQMGYSSSEGITDIFGFERPQGSLPPPLPRDYQPHYAHQHQDQSYLSALPSDTYDFTLSLPPVSEVSSTPSYSLVPPQVPTDTEVQLQPTTSGISTPDSDILIGQTRDEAEAAVDVFFSETLQQSIESASQGGDTPIGVQESEVGTGLAESAEL